MKKRVVFLLVAILSFCCVLTACVDAAPPADLPPPIDHSTIHMYLIAGQSNAAGISPVSTASEADMTKTFDNVWYAGETERVLSTGIAYSSYGILDANNGTNASSFSADFVKVRAGLGRASNNIGPEYGMASVLNDRYDGARKAFIFKTAAGGTTVRNIFAGDTNAERFGNWYPPSLREKLPQHEQNAGTGALFDRFIENFSTVYTRLVDDGHTVRIMGMTWMQGESDRATDEIVANYPMVLSELIADFRDALGEITGDDLSRMPFVAGEISRTHGVQSGSTQSVFDESVARNEAFNVMLNAIEQNSTIPYFRVTEAADLPQNKMEDGLSVQLNPVDHWHWIADHMVTLGERFIGTLDAML